MQAESYTILYCGSFNPIHKGHIVLAEEVLNRYPQCNLWVVVSPQNPLKRCTDLAPEEHRLQMARIAVQHSACADRIQVCDIEFHLPKPSATIHTLHALTNTYPKQKFALLIGSDNAQCFDRWIAHDEIVADYPILVYPRKGWPMPDNNLTRRMHYLADFPLFPQAATNIRKQIGLLTTPQSPIPQTDQQTHLIEESAIANELPEGVWEYIKLHQLYGYR